MEAIILQQRTRALNGVIDSHWFENEKIGLLRTLFHRIVIPLEPFDSGLDYISQPESTEIYIDWVNLGISETEKPSSFNLTKDGHIDYEASIYIGAAHNPIHVEELRIEYLGEDMYTIQGKIHVDFEYERVAQNEYFQFQTTLEYRNAT